MLQKIHDSIQYINSILRKINDDLSPLRFNEDVLSEKFTLVDSENTTVISAHTEDEFIQYLHSYRRGLLAASINIARSLNIPKDWFIEPHENFVVDWWHIDDVNHLDPSLTDTQAREILQNAHRDCPTQLSSEYLEIEIEEYLSNLKATETEAEEYPWERILHVSS